MGGEMKSCPHCGGGAVTFERPFGAYRVRCENGCNDLYKDKEGAIAAWNRRSPDPELVEALERFVRIFEWRHDESHSARIEYDNAAEVARALLSRIRERR